MVHKFSVLHNKLPEIIDLKKHSFLIPRFPWVKVVGIASLGSLLSQQSAKYSQSVFSSGGSAREESTSSLIWLITGCHLENGLRS